MSGLINKFLEPFSYLIYTVTLVVSIYYQRSVTKAFLLLYYIFSTAIIFYGSLLAFYKTLGDNNWVYNLFFLVTIVVLSCYFHRVLFGRGKKTLVKILLVVNILLFVWYDIVLKKFDGYYNNQVVAFCFLSIVAYSFLYFHQLINNVNEESILLDFDFWLISGYLLYFLGAFFVILFYQNAAVSQRGFVWGLQSIILFLSAIITLSGNLWIRNQNKPA